MSGGLAERNIMDVTVYSHNFAVRGYNRSGYDFLKKFSINNFGETDFRAIRINKMPSRFGKKPLPTIKKTYAACTNDGREFRFHRNTLDLFKLAVSNEPGLCGKVNYEEEPMYVPEHVGLTVLPKWTPRELQVPLIAYFNAPGSSKVLNLQTGQGKATLISELVLTPTGWVTIGDIKIGDQVRCPDNSIAFVNGVFPQGIVRTYSFKFKGVEKPFVCCREHLWEISINGKVSVVDSRSLYEHFNWLIEGSIQVPRVSVNSDYSVTNERLVDIESIQEHSEEECTCISITHPRKVYVTTDGIVTHNTYCSLTSSAFHGDRLAICIESRFFSLWAEALDPDSDKQVLDLKKDEVLWIQGSKDFKALLQLGLTNQLDGIKVIVIALRTMANYIETYLRYGEDMLTVYPVLPIDFHKSIKAGTALKDEVHLSLYANYMEELFSHVPRRFSLSATLEDGSFKDKIFGIMFPMDQRLDTGPLKQYIDVTALKYRLREPSKVKYSVRGSSDYNHNAFEQWIISDRGRLNNYLKMILDWVDRRFIRQTYFEGQKCAVFVSSIEMATEVWKYLRKNIPHWNVSRYAASAGDIYDESKQADIMVTTEKSFSTGFDLPGLVCALLTVSINSFNTNVQILGRLRELRDHPELSPIFDYLVCEDIQKHIDYHEEKKNTIFKDRVKSHKIKYMNIVV